MKNELKFTACKHLDFSDEYAAKKEPINIMGKEKVCWNRPVIDDTYPKLVQFCKLRGRLNNKDACLFKMTKECSDYDETEHKVKF